MRLYFFLLSLLFATSTFAQSLFPEPGSAFQDATIPRIDISINSDSLAFLLKEENIWENHEYPATFTWDDGSNSITLEDIGFRLRGNTSRESGKKSFKVDFTKFGGKRFHELSEMNLNGEHNDPSVMRSKLCWDLYKMAGIPSTHANHVALYINNVYYGLYLNVEHIDKQFLRKRWNTASGNLYKCFWGADLDFISLNPDHYKHQPFGNRIYDLKTNRQQDDYSDLANFIAILNSPGNPDFRCLLEETFNVDSYLRAMAMDILTGNWDGPIFNKNNFYLYANPRTGKMEYLPYDLDNTFGIDWFGLDWTERDIYNWAQGGQPRPIYRNLLSVPEYRDRMSFYVQQFAQDFFNTNYLDLYLNDFRDHLSPFMVNDTFARIDYGFTYDDFLSAYESGWGAHVPFGIKEYLNKRVNTANSQLQINAIAPAMSRENFEWNENEMIFSVFVADDGDPAVKLHYAFDGQPWQNDLSMQDDGIAPDVLAGDGVYTISFPYPGYGSLDYYFEAEDNSLSSRWPFCSDLRSYVGRQDVPQLFINEFMADNSYTVADEFGEYDDWLEIYNASSETVYLGDKYLSDKHSNPDKWPLPDESIEPGGFLIFWCDEDQTQGSRHTNFKLSNNGEELGLWDSATNNFAPIDTFTYGEIADETPWGRYPDGQGPITELSWRTPGYSNVPLAAEEVKSIAIKLYPNPTRQWLSLRSAEPIEEVVLVGIDGQVQMQELVQRSDWKLDLKDLSSGIYFLEIRFASQRIWRKIIRQ